LGRRSTDSLKMLMNDTGRILGAVVCLGELEGSVRRRAPSTYGGGHFRARQLSVTLG
jgi:hypothetical protein